MPNGDPRDGFFFPTLTFMIDSNILYVNMTLPTFFCIFVNSNGHWEHFKITKINVFIFLIEGFYFRWPSFHPNIAHVETNKQLENCMQYTYFSRTVVSYL